MSDDRDTFGTHDESYVAVTRVRGLKSRLAIALGRRTWAQDGRCDVPLNVMIVNFWFQRVLRLNAGCRYPVHFTSTVVEPTRLKLGLGVARYLATSGALYIQALNGVTIGDGTIIAPGVKIVSANHSSMDFGAWTSAKPITIGQDCWIGANSVILPGVSIGNGSIIGAGAVVTRDVPERNVALGVPAQSRPIRAGENEAG